LPATSVVQSTPGTSGDSVNARVRGTNGTVGHRRRTVRHPETLACREIAELKGNVSIVPTCS
jgi:hypothetical protein